jgi:ionotropic glutamate receptor
MDRMAYGMFMEIMKVFEQEMNFTANFFKRMDNKWGSLNKNTKKWNGMISNLLEGSADFICASLTMKLDRSTAVRYLPQLGQNRDVIAIKTPDNSESSWVTFVSPFSWLLWCVITLTSFGMAILIWFVNQYRNKYQTFKVIHKDQK